MGFSIQGSGLRKVIRVGFGEMRAQERPSAAKCNLGMSKWQVDLLTPGKVGFSHGGFRCQLPPKTTRMGTVYNPYNANSKPLTPTP